MNLKDQSITIILSKFLQGKCSEQELLELETWKDADQKNLALFQELTDAKLLGHKLSAFNNFDKNNIWENIVRSEEVDRRNSKAFPIKRIYLAIAASVAVLIVLGGILYNYQKTSETLNNPKIVKSFNPKYDNDILPASKGAMLVLEDGKQIPLSDNLEISHSGDFVSEEGKILDASKIEEIKNHVLLVPSGQYFSFRLSDGTKVKVNAGSKLSFPSKFTGDFRKVELLEGEAYFEVVKNENQPFVVKSGDREIKVLGTKFNVNNRRHQFETTLLEGSVEASNSTHRQLLKPGNKAIYKDANIDLRKANISKDFAWVHDIFYFEKDGLKEVMRQIEDWYGVRVIVIGKADVNTTFSGEIKRNSNLSDVLDLLEFTSGYKFAVEKDKLYVKPN